MMGKRKFFVPLVGTESEYGMLSRIYEKVIAAIQVCLISRQRVIPGCSGGGFWTAQGGRYYVDYGNHLEYASPECTTPAQIAAYEWAGVWITQAFYRLAEQSLPASLKVMLLKNNTGRGGAPSFGNHLNVLMPTQGNTFLQALASFAEAAEALAATMPLFVGAGLVFKLPVEEDPPLALGTNTYGFRICARSRFVDRVLGDSSTASHERPFFLQRDEPHADAAEHWRLQMLSLDANILQAVIELKMGMLMLVAMMWMAGELEPVYLQDPVAAYKSVSHDWRELLPVRSGSAMSPAKVQLRYLEQAEAFVRRYRLSLFNPILMLWRRQAEVFLAAPVNDLVPASLEGINDWVTKHLIIQKSTARRGELEYDRAEQIQHTYHGFNLGAGFETSVPFRLAARYGRPRFVAMTKRASKVPPRTSRALIRGEFTKLIWEVGGQPRLSPQVNWATLACTDWSQKLRPFTTQLDGVEELRRHLLGGS